MKNKKMWILIGLIVIILVVTIVLQTNTHSRNEGDISFSNPSKLEVFYHVSISSVLFHSFYADYIETMHLQGNENILDFGSGWGTEAEIMAQQLAKGGNITCLDISPTWMEVCKKRLAPFQSVDFIVGDVTKLNIQESTYDIVVIHFVLHDIEDVYRNNIIKSLAKLLKTGGKIYIREPLLTERNISFKSLSELMIVNGLKEKQLIQTSSLFNGKRLEGIFEK